MKVTPLKAIRLKCLDCSNNSSGEVKFCPIEDCPLYAFRFGKNPYRKKRVYTEAQKVEMTERLRRGNSKTKGAV